MNARGVLLGVTLALAACQSRRPAAPKPPPAPAFKASCSLPELGVCTEYTDAAFALGETSVKTVCTGSRGLWSPARCPVEQQVGRCATGAASRRYYAPRFSAATAAKDCTELYQGSWAGN